ncbi:MAG: hypothetical protein AB2814_05005 [Candidatus Sedimenticola endophacoides]
MENPNTITSPDELREWMDELPIANPLLTAENLLLSLQLLNRHPGALSELPELLSLYLHMFGDLLDLLRSGAGKPSAVGRRARADLDETVQQINKELAFGYKRAILARQAIPMPREVAAEILTNGLKFLANELMFAYVHYRREPANTRMEIMQIFLLAERLRVSGADIGDAGYASAAPTVRLAFKRILLVSILHPYRLQPGEAWALFDYLRQTADLARLSQFRQRDKTEGCFLVPVRGPVRHLHYDSSSLPEGSEQMLLLDTTSLNVRAYQDLSTIKSGRSDPASLFGALGRHGTERLLHTLLVNWHLRPRRRHARQERYNWVVAACGLDAIREYLEREQTPNRSDTGTPEQMEETIHIVDRMPGIRTREHETHRWRQIDISSSGVALTLPADEAGRNRPKQKTHTET